MLFCTAGYVLLPTSSVWANPTGEKVVGGAASFQRAGNTLTVNQTTDRLAVNWKDFSIAAGEKTHFNMPSATSIALNRVLGGNPSQIFGTLSANGQLILYNSAGIAFGPNSQVNTASFVGTTRDINPDEFMLGGPGKAYNLIGDSTAPIINQGNIKAEKGDVFLIAQKVENRGTISAPNGKAALVGTGAGGDRTEVVLHEQGGAGFAVRVAQLQGAAARGDDGALPDGEELLNEGEIAAAQAELNASGNIYALAIKNSGTIRAKAVVASADGTVRLDGGLGDVVNTGRLVAKNAGSEATAAGGKIEVTGQNVTASPESIITAAGGVQGGAGGQVKLDSADTTMVQGKVDVTAPSAVAKGGKVELLGERVGLFDGAKVDASGGAGGGAVLVGGDYLGGQTPKPEFRDLAKQESEPVKNAKATVMADTAEIKADATANGDGGKIILWSDEYTGFFGELFARGGMQGGNGGFIETSSKNIIQIAGIGMAYSPKGDAGLWLLDPVNVTISGNATTGGQLPSWTPGNLNSGVASNINDADLIAALNSGTSVTVTTAGNVFDNNGGLVAQDGNISLNSSITSANAVAGLTLSADKNISINASVSIGGAINLTAQNGGSVTLTGNLTSANSDVTINSPTSVTGGGAITATVGNIFVNSGSGAISLTGGLTATQGRILLSSGNGGDITIGGTVNANSFNVSAGVDDATTSIIFASGAQITANSIGLNARNDITLAGSSIVTLNGTGGSSSVFRADAQNGSLSGTGTLQAASGIFDLRAQKNISLTLDNSTASGNVNFRALVRGEGSIDITSPDSIVLQQVDFGGGTIFTPFMAANTTAGTDANPLGDVIVSAGGILDQGVATISGGRLVALTSPTQIITRGQITAGWQLALNAPNIDLGAASSFVITDPSGTSAATPGFVFGGLVNSLSSDPSLASGLTLDMSRRAGLVTSFTSLVGSLRPLAFFVSNGGTIEFRATGASDSTPSIAVVNPGNFPSSGYINTGSSDLVLFTDTYLRAQGDVIIGGNVTSGLTNADFANFLARFDLATTVPLGVAEPKGGQIIINGALGTDAAPLGKVVVVAQGTRPPDTTDPIDPVTTRKDAQISINGGIITLPGTNPLNPGADGGVSLSADGAIVLISAINTAGGATVGQNTVIGGNVYFKADLDSDGLPNENIQLGGDGNASIRTRGGFIQFDGDTYLVQSANFNTTPGNVSGSITFNGKFDGVAPLVLDAGIAPIFFKGLVGSLTPAGLTVTASGGIDFASDVTMGGAYSLAAEGTGVTFNGRVDGRQALTVNSQTGDIQFKRAVGSVTPIASLTVGPGGLRPVGELDKVYFFGDVTTQGLVGTPGSSFVTINKDTVINKSGTFTFKTNARENVTGGNLNFLGSVTLGSGYDTDLAFEAGSGGNVVFNGNVGSLDSSYNPVGDQFGTIAIKSAAGVGMGDAVVVYAAGRSVGSATIQIDAALNSFFPQGSLTFKAGIGDILIPRGGDLSGTISGANNNTAGSKLLATILGVGNIILGGLLNVSGGDNDTSGTGGGSGGPGYNSGYVVLYAPNGYVEVGSVAASGGASATFGSGGNGLTFGQVPSGDLSRIGLAGNSYGAINLLGKNVIVNGALVSNGGAGTTSIGGTGGGVQINLLGNAVDLANGVIYKNTRASFRAGSIYANGGASSGLVGGNGGDVRIMAENGFLVSPTTFALAGGTGANNNIQLAGRGGNVNISANSPTGDIFFDNTQFSLTGNGNISIKAGHNLVLRYRNYDVSIDGLGKVENFNVKDLGGVVISINQVAQGQSLSQTQRGQLSLSFSQYANGDYVYGKDSTGSSLLAGFYMPSNAYILTNGGQVTITGGGFDFFGQPLAGNAVLSGLSTSGTDVDGGNVVISNKTTTSLGDVTFGSSLETYGGTPLLPTYGRKGGNVDISARNIIMRRIDARGSASLASATAPAVGGAGGDVTLTASAGRTITLKRDIIASGGTGNGVGDATGGAGGNVTLIGNVTLATGEPDRPSVLIDTTGGLGKGDGEVGQGGTISWNGRSGGILQGTQANSNTLDLRYGSGTVELGTDSGDTINLGELITAANDARSTGVLRVKANMNAVTTLTTYARGYNIELLGGGTVENPTTFLNTGYVQIGDEAGDITTFAGGINTQGGPGGTVLAGTLRTSNQLLDTEASILLGAVQLRGNTFLDSFGNTLALGSVDSIDTPYDLTFLKGIGEGPIQLTGNFGGNVDKPSIFGSGSPLKALKTIKFADDLSRSTPIVFVGTVNAESVVSRSTTPLEFRQNTLLTGDTDINGNVTLNNVQGGSTVMTFKLGDGSLLAGNVLLKGGAILLDGTGDWGINGSVSGGQNLTVGGSGNRDFNGAFTVGSLTLQDSATKNFNLLSTALVPWTVTASAITQGGGRAVFKGGVKTTGASSFSGPTTLDGMTFYAGGTTTFANLSLAASLPLSTVVLTGAGSYTVTALTGAGVALTLGSTGTTTFNGSALNLGRVTVSSGSGTVAFTGAAGATGFTQASGAGALTFGTSVTTSSTSSFNGTVTLGSSFSAGGQTDFAKGGVVNLGADVALSGTGAYNFYSALVGGGNDLTSSATTLNLAAGGTGIGLMTVSSGSTTVGGGLGATGLTQSGGNLALNATITIGGGSGTAQFSGGTTSLSGIQLKGLANIQGGTVTTTGNTTITGTVTYGSGDLTSNSGLLTLASGLTLTANFTLDGVGNYSVASVTGLGRTLTLGGSGAKNFTGDIGSSGARLTSLSQTGGRVTVSGGVYTSGNLDIAGLTVSGPNVALDSSLGTITLGGVQGSGDLAVKAETLDVNGSVANSGTFSATRNGNLSLGGGSPYLDATEVGRIQSSGGATFTSLSGSVTASAVTLSRNLNLVSQIGNVNVEGTAVGGGLAISALNGAATFNLPLSTAQSLSLAAKSVSGLENIRTGTFGNINVSSTSATPVTYITPGDLTISSGSLKFGSSTVGMASTSGTIISTAGNVNPFGKNVDVTLYSQNLFDSQLQGAFIPGATFVRGAPPAGGTLGILAVGTGSLTVYYNNLNNFLPYTSQFTTGTGQPYILATENAVPSVMRPVPVNFSGGFASQASYSAEEVEMMTPTEREAYETAKRQQAGKVILERQGGQIPQAKASDAEKSAPTAQAPVENTPLAGKSKVPGEDATQVLRARPSRSVSLRLEQDPSRVMDDERLAAEVHVGSAPVAGNQ